MRKAIITIGAILLIAGCSSSGSDSATTTSTPEAQASTTTEAAAETTTTVSALSGEIEVTDVALVADYTAPQSLYDNGVLNDSHDPVAIDVTWTNGTDLPEILTWTLTTDQGDFSGIAEDPNDEIELPPGQSQQYRVVFAMLTGDTPASLTAANYDGETVYTQDL